MSAGPNRPCPYLGELSVTEGCRKVSIDVMWIAMCRCKCQQVALSIRVKPCAMYVGQVLSDTNSQSITSTQCLPTLELTFFQVIQCLSVTRSIHIVGLITYTCK